MDTLHQREGHVLRNRKPILGTLLKLTAHGDTDLVEPSLAPLSLMQP
jgi:hypothetical protein